MSDLYDLGTQLGNLLRGLVSGLGQPTPTGRAPAAGAAAPGAAVAAGAQAVERTSRTGAVEPAHKLIRPSVFSLLLALTETEHSGSGLMASAAVASQGAVTLGQGTLYRSLQRLRADGLVQESDGAALGDDGGMGDTSGLAAERRKTFRMTTDGMQALREQASQIITLAEAAQRAGFTKLPMPAKPTGKPDPVPEEFSGLLPHLIVGDAAAAFNFYKQAFDADELWRDVGPDGRIWHLEMLVRGTRVPLADEFSGMKLVSPSRDGNSVVLHQYVDDVDGAFKQAVRAGAEGLLPPMDSYWGDRYSQVQDPFGHRWALASRIEDLSPEQQRHGAKSFREAQPDLALEPPM
jgi:PhnB protein